MKNVFFIFLLLFFVGCQEKEVIVKVPTYRKINIPKNLLITYEAPKVPNVLNEETISKYTLDLYTNFQLNKSKKEQIQTLISDFNNQK